MSALTGTALGWRRSMRRAAHRGVIVTSWALVRDSRRLLASTSWVSGGPVRPPAPVAEPRRAPAARWPVLPPSPALDHRREIDRLTGRPHLVVIRGGATAEGPDGAEWQGPDAPTARSSGPQMCWPGADTGKTR